MFSNAKHASLLQQNDIFQLWREMMVKMKWEGLKNDHSLYQKAFSKVWQQKATPPHHNPPPFPQPHIAL